MLNDQLIKILNNMKKNDYFEIKIEKDKVYCGSGVIVDNCEKCGSDQHLYCSGDCKWSNGKCVLRGKFLKS